MPDGNVPFHLFPMVELAPDEMIRVRHNPDFVVQATVAVGITVRRIATGAGWSDFAVDRAATVQFLAYPIRFAPTSEAPS